MTDWVIFYPILIFLPNLNNTCKIFNIYFIPGCTRCLDGFYMEHMLSITQPFLDCGKSKPVKLGVNTIFS